MNPILKLFAAGSCAALLWAAAPGPATTTAVANEEDSALHDAMEGMKKNLKALGKALSDPATRDQALDHLAEMQRLTLISKLEAPSNLEEIEEDKRAEHMTAYRIDMAKMLMALAEMEIDVLEGRAADAGKKIRSTLLKMRKNGHNLYQPEEEDEDEDEDG